MENQTFYRKYEYAKSVLAVLEHTPSSAQAGGISPAVRRIGRSGVVRRRG